MKNTSPSLAATLLCSTLLLAGCSKEPSTPPHSKWISEIVEYRPAPGQFINTTLGTPEAASGIIGGRQGLVSLGSFGGQVTFRFDHDLRNIPGTDFVIFGNAFDSSSEPGIVSVSPDGTTWYPLKGSENDKPQTIHNYQITYTRPAQTDRAEAVAWADNQGQTGTIGTVSAHPQCYYPLFPTNNSGTLTFSGTLLAPNSVFENNQFKQKPYEWGYADNWSVDYNEIASGDPDTRGSNKFDLDNAVDANGNPVTLTSVRLIKVSTALNQMVGGGVGETSTEVGGALSLSANLSE